MFALGLTFRNEKTRDPSQTEEGERNAHRGKLGIALQTKVTWIAAIFIFLYQGAEVALGGWLITFMIQVPKFKASKLTIYRSEVGILQEWVTRLQDSGSVSPWVE